MAAMASPSGGGGGGRVVKLPAGFRFHPTDEELIVHYLMNQAASMPCPVPIIAEVNIYQCNPWDLPAKAVFGESEWYFFSPRDRKYPNGARPNRAAGSGYWKATGTDKAILSSSSSTPAAAQIGVKKALVFYAGRPPRGAKTDWIMHEYRLAAAGKTAKCSRGSMRLDDWVLCRIHKKSNDFQLPSPSEQEQEGSSTVEDDSPKPEPHLERDDDDQFQFHQTTTMTMSKSCSLTDLLNSIDCSALSQILDDGPLLPPPADAGEEALPPPLPQQNPPLNLIYPTTTTTTTKTHQSLINNNKNNNDMNNSHLNHLPHADAACSDYVVANNNNYGNGVNKRKRMMAGMDDDDDSSGFGTTKLKAVLPSDSGNGSGHFGSTSSSGYCNQQVVDTSGLFHQYSSLLTSSYPFLKMQ